VHGGARSRQGGGRGFSAAAAAAIAASDEDADLAAAIAASLADQPGQQEQNSPRSVAAATAHDDVEESKLAAAIALSLGQPAVQERQQPEQQQHQQQQAGQEVEQARLPPVQLPELAPEPEAGAEGAVEVALRLPGGARIRRRFRASDPVGQLAAAAAAHGADMVACRLALTFPRRLLDDWAASLEAAGLAGKQRLLVTVEPTVDSAS
jgi:ataxin-3